MDSLIISEVKSDQSEIYKTFFMRGLIEDDEKFRISPDDEMKEDFPTLDKADSFTLGAYLDGQLAGVVSFERDGAKREKLRHKGTLFRMLIAKEFRQQGVGKKLIEEVIQKAKTISDIEQINLTVIALNHTAKQLYEKYGFKVFSVEEHATKWKEKYYTEETMVLRLQ
ncbi:MAG: GNAT family N-acetyltransferase [Opitutaceae bacterium]|nr:GNAT family N-acetyltransferase [Cytophagales bacterium]